MMRIELILSVCGDFLLGKLFAKDAAKKSPAYGMLKKSYRGVNGDATANKIWWPGNNS